MYQVCFKCFHYCNILITRINAQSQVIRTIDEIKKKLSDMKSTLKRRERERRQLMQQTGGGPPPTLNEWDEKVIFNKK